VLDHPNFINGDYNTHFIQNHLPADKRLDFVRKPLSAILLDEVLSFPSLNITTGLLSMLCV